MKETTPYIALVTGASRGIGAAIALELAHQGFVVIGTATTDEGATKISNALSAHAKCRGVNLNVNDAAAVDALVEQITTEHKALHVLVNNAGIIRDTMSFSMNEEQWDDVIRVHLKGHAACAHFAGCHWRDRIDWCSFCFC